jgi:hypothetical protein
MYIHIFLYKHIYIHEYVYIYMYIYRYMNIYMYRYIHINSIGNNEDTAKIREYGPTVLGLCEDDYEVCFL